MKRDLHNNIFNKPLIFYTTPKTREDKRNFKKIIETIKENFPNFKLLNRNKTDNIKIANINKKLKENSQYDLIITIGGDGSFLKIAQYINSKPILAINLNSKIKEGFYTSLNENNINKINKLKENQFKIISLPTLSAKINNKKIKEIAINEFFFGNKISYLSARYKIKIKSKKREKGKNSWEYQKSSGVIIATPQGTNSWYKSAGGKPLNLTNIEKFRDKYFLIIREPYKGKIIKCNICNLMLHKNQRVMLKSGMKEGILVIDSFIEKRIRENDNIEISLGEKDIKLIKLLN